MKSLFPTRLRSFPSDLSVDTAVCREVRAVLVVHVVWGNHSAITVKRCAERLILNWNRIRLPFLIHTFVVVYLSFSRVVLQQAITVAEGCVCISWCYSPVQVVEKLMCQQQCVCQKEALGEELVLQTARAWPNPGTWGPPGAGEEHTDSIWNRVLHRLKMIALHTLHFSSSSAGIAVCNKFHGDFILAC